MPDQPNSFCDMPESFLSRGAGINYETLIHSKQTFIANVVAEIGVTYEDYVNIESSRACKRWLKAIGDITNVCSWGWCYASDVMVEAGFRGVVAILDHCHEGGEAPQFEQVNGLIENTWFDVSRSHVIRQDANYSYVPGCYVGSEGTSEIYGVLGDIIDALEIAGLASSLREERWQRLSGKLRFGTVRVSVETDLPADHPFRGWGTAWCHTIPSLISKVSYRAVNLLLKLRRGGISKRDYARLTKNPRLIKNALVGDSTSFSTSRERSYLRRIHKVVPIRTNCTACTKSVKGCKCKHHPCGCFSSLVNGMCANAAHTFTTIEVMDAPISKVGRANRKFPRYVGVELELTGFARLRGCEERAVRTKLAKLDACVKYDGSLPSDGREINMPPRRGTALPKNIVETVQALKYVGAETETEAGVHMHVDVADFDLEDFKKLCGMWHKLESLVMAAMPEHRRSNEHCVRWHKSADWYNAVEMNFTKGSIARQFNNENRYKTLNFRSYKSDRQTVEFRMVEATLDTDRLISLAEIFTGIIQAAKKVEISKVRTAFEKHDDAAMLAILPSKIQAKLISEIVRAA